MIVKSISNKRASLAAGIRELAYPEGADESILDITVGKCYEVYAIKEDDDGIWYFVHTDEQNIRSLWWMPAVIYEVVDESIPRGWIKRRYSQDHADVYNAYASLFDWKVENGIIDGEDWAINQYMDEVLSDKSFPAKSTIDKLNQELNQKLVIEQYHADLRLSKERGYERPEKPDAGEL